MPRYAQLVMGPAGSGKSTYCSNMVKHCNALRRTVGVVNLDPAAEYFDYPVTADIRDLIELKDVMEEDDLRFGPNGGLVFCMEYLAQNWEWLHEAIGEDEDGDYILFDCPGQIELYTHVPVMAKLIEQLQGWGFMLCGVFLLDSQFLVEPSKFLAGSLTALSAMVHLAVPHINLASKLDLLSKQAKKNLDRYLEPSMEVLLAEEFNDKAFSHRFKKLNTAFAKVLDDFRMVKFMPLDPSDEGTIDDILAQIDTCLQYEEDLEHFDNRALDNAEVDPEFGETDSGYGGVGE